MNQFNLSHFSDYTDEAPLPRPDFDAYLQQSTRHELKQQIANQSNSFSPEQLDQFSTEQLRGIATLASGNTTAAKSPNHYVNDGGLFGEGVSDDESDEEAPLPRPASWI